MCAAPRRPAEATPVGWYAPAHRLWQQQRQAESIGALIAHLNTLGVVKPTVLVLQLTYYLFLINDHASVVRLLTLQTQHDPRHPELWINLAVALGRLQRYGEALQAAEEARARQPDNVMIYDVLTANYHALGQIDKAVAAGTQSLTLKDTQAGQPSPGWRLPSLSAASFAGQPGKRQVIAFSLWGNAPRYLRGAVHNVLQGHRHYPGWVLQFHVDATVPELLRDWLASQGAQVVLHPDGASLREKLCWRFLVANAKDVGYFLVRDVDSVLSAREAQAVAAWMASGQWFHILRDWWTHTDLMLAGMWGGIAGVLPPLAPLLRRYTPRHAETRNVDQWFLRDCVWPYVRHNCLTHDRCFRLPGALRPPGEIPEGDRHIGQDEHAVRADEQAALLTAALTAHPGLVQALALIPAS